MITQHHQPEGHAHHRVVVDLGPTPENLDAKALRPLAEAEATQRCVPDCFRKGATATQIGDIRSRSTEEGERLSAIVYVKP